MAPHVSGGPLGCLKMTYALIGRRHGREEAASQITSRYVVSTDHQIYDTGLSELSIFEVLNHIVI